MGNQRSQNGAGAENPQQFLHAAQEAVDAGQFAAAVIHAHTSCEVAIAQRLRLGKVEKEAIRLCDLKSSFPKLLKSAFGLDIKAEPFWESFCKLVEKRNAVLHSGQKVTAADAQRALYAAEDFVNCLEPVTSAEGPVAGQFVDDVRKRLELLGMSQKELAVRARISPVAVSRLLSGQRTPSLETAARIAKALKCKATLRLASS